MLRCEMENARWACANKGFAVGLIDTRENDRDVEHTAAALAALTLKRRDTNIAEKL